MGIQTVVLSKKREKERNILQKNHLPLEKLSEIDSLNLKKSIDLYRISTFMQSQLPHIPHIFYISIADYKKEKYIPSRVTDA